MAMEKDRVLQELCSRARMLCGTIGWPPTTTTIHPQLELADDEKNKLVERWSLFGASQSRVKRPTKDVFESKRSLTWRKKRVCLEKWWEG